MGQARKAEGTIRILVADSDGLARNALRSALDNGRRSVVGQAADTERAVALAARVAPHVVLLDETLPPGGGLAALPALAAAAPASRTILLGREDDDDGGVRALAHGAAGYLWRGIDLGSLARAVDGVIAGEPAISRTMAGRLVESLRELSASRPGMRPVRSSLTDREWEVLDLLKDGASTAEIARELVLSPETVHSHVQHIFRKLDAHTRAEAVRIAERRMHGGPLGEPLDR